MSPKGKNSVGYRWAFTIKYEADGITKQYNVRLIVKDLLSSWS